MKKYLAYGFYFLYWILFFIAAKIVFLIYHLPLARSLTPLETAEVFLYGLRMDASFTGYICLFPFLLFLVQAVMPQLGVRKTVRIYTWVVVAVISFLIVADLELYNAWGFRMDATPLQYFKTPKEMGATISTAPVLLLMVIMVFFEGIFIFVYNRYFDRFMSFSQKKFRTTNVLLSVFLLALLFVPIRGGLQKIPINVSDAYFSRKIFADHAAINLPWNIMFSILNSNDKKNPFDYYSMAESRRLVDSLYDTGPVRIPAILSESKPNVIIIILESFTAKWLGCLGGVPGVTPNLDSIAARGLLFTRIYAAGDRSEKGQVAVLSGYPNQAINSIIKTPTKTRGLPSINQVLEKEGYRSSYTYGGELEFANIKSYLINIRMDQLTDKYSFPVTERTTSWGVHDQYVFDEFYKDIQTKHQPFFATLFTLSSHEPYDVPMKPRFKGAGQTTLFKNSVYYTDSVVGSFIRKLQKLPLWNHTLVVFVADHGHPLPGHDPVDAPSKFHIPLIFSGGALKLKGKINAIGSQTDIARTLLDQLGVSAKSFVWSKDLLDSSARRFAFYCFNNGFGWVAPSGTETYSNVSRKPIFISPGFDTSQIRFGKAYMQASYQDYLDR